MREKILQREVASRSLPMMSPPMLTQLLFNDLAGTSLQNYLQFLDQTQAFHEKLRLYFYPMIFQNAPVKSVDWKNFKPAYANTALPVNWTMALVPMFTAFLGLLLLAVVNMKRWRTIQ